MSTDAAKIKSLVLTRNKYFAKLSKCFDIGQNCLDLISKKQPHSDHYEAFISRIQVVDEDYESFNRLCHDIALLNLQVKEEDRVHVEQSLDACDDLYFGIKTLARKLNIAPVTSSGPSAQVQPPSMVNNAKLPKIEIDPFHGNISSWPNFYSLFMSLIHKNSGLTNSERLTYLRSLVKGQALSIIETLPISDENYSIALELLVNRYQNKRLLASNYLDKIFSIRSINEDTITGYNNFIMVFNTNLSALKALNIPDLFDFTMLHAGLRSLPVNTRKLFERNYPTDIPKFEDLQKFIQQQLRILELTHIKERPKNIKHFSTDKPSRDTSNHNTRNTLLSATSKNSSNTPQKTFNFNANKAAYCSHCNDSAHKIYACPKFKELTVQQRYDIVKAKFLCFSCLGFHRQSVCKSTSKCNYCSSPRHHSLLHYHSQQVIAAAPSEAKSDHIEENTNALNCNNAVTSHKVLLGTALIGIRDKYGQIIKVRALIDNGSQVSLITEACAQKLNLKRFPSSVGITALGELSLPRSKGLVTCKIHPLDKQDVSLLTDALIIPKICVNQPNMYVNPLIYKSFSHLQLADPDFHKSAKIEFLIGRDIYDDILCTNAQIIKGKPSATPTIFGYIIGGQLKENTAVANVTTNLTCCESLNKSIQKFWETESIKRVNAVNPEDEVVESHFINTLSRNEDGRYIVNLAFKNNPPRLPETRKEAQSRLINLEKRLSKNPDQFTAYRSFMEDYIELGHMSLATEKSSYIIPHHVVLKESSSTTKLRTVFNASYKPNGSYLSLNENLYTGPKLQLHISDILLNFRLGAITVCADLKQMYRQILVSPEQRKYQHIFYRTTVDGPIEEYALNTVTYGMTPSAYLSQRVLHQLVKDEGSPFPLASQVILTSTFVDDICTSTDTPEEALQLQKELIEIFSLGGFSLRKWLSNSQLILDQVPETHREQRLIIKGEDDHAMKVLGLQYEPYSDTFSYSVLPCSRDIIITKRKVLSEISRIYDPLGWLSPLTFLGKVIMQKTWLLGLDWDQELPAELKEKWSEFISTLPAISNLKIPRYMPFKNSKITIVGFCDASEKGYAANLYLRSETSQIIKVFLLTSKSRVAPLKVMSIPRLELSAAHLLVQLLKSINNFLERIQNYSIVLFTDSSVVLSWLHTPPHKLKTFVANRIVSILEETTPSQWRHVSSQDNPCDCASRGLLPNAFLNLELWWKGPQFLYSPIESWMLSDPVSKSDIPTPELKVESLVLTKTKSSLLLSLIDKYSSLSKVRGVIAFIFRFVHNTQCAKKNLHRRHGPLNLIELKESLMKCIKVTQEYYFECEIRFLSNGKLPSKRYRSLAPFLDKDGFLRVGGRLVHSNLKFSAKHPLLIPKESHLAILICNYYHLLSLHGGPRITQTLIQQRFWIISLRNMIRQCIFKCSLCYKFKAKPMTQQMADLPSSRFQEIRPFIHTGIDYAGPILYKESHRRKACQLKGYLSLFICLSTKAVHLEFVSSLSTPSFLAALDRFLARRGLCRIIFSDCGSNFKGASRHFSEVQSFLKTSNPDIAQYLSSKEIIWEFNPPNAPHFGGLWESGIKSAKHHLVRIMGNSLFTFEEMTTILARIEAVLNSRPLGPLTSDPNDGPFLSPGHFIIGSSLLAPPEVDLTREPINRLSRYQLLQQAAQSFWRKWSRDYLPTLIRRDKWTTPQPNLKENDVVYLHMKDTTPLQWPIGRIIQTYPGQDGRVRVVKVKTPQGEYVRPINKLVALPPLKD